jgi:D-glycero-alpha-D-manno-heptose-7-phosphate kinase
MRDLANSMRHAIMEKADMRELAALLHEGWELKRTVVAGITDPHIDAWYEAGRKAGALGGKLLGAGGGGFLLLMAPPERHNNIREALGRPRELKFQIDRLGSRIIFVS